MVDTSKVAPTRLQQRVTTLARAALVVVAFGTLLLLLELSALHCNRSKSDSLHCSFLRRSAISGVGAANAHEELDELGLHPHELEHELPQLPVWLQPLDNASDVPADELLHMSLLHASCLANAESVIPWNFGQPGVDQMSDRRNDAMVINRDDPKLLEYLRQCPDVDIYLPAGIRGHGYCEDAVAYTKFLETRMLPRWVFDSPLFDAQLNRNVTYYELCPKTPILFFNHYWDGLPSAPAFPKSKPVYLMPNIEMFELDERFFWRADLVICKTLDCEQRLIRWYKQEGNPRHTKVFYTRHTSSDVAGFARKKLGDAAINRKDFTNVKFIHTAGSSGWKGTRQVLDCWLKRPDFPPLDLYVAEGIYKYRLEPDYGERIADSANKNLNVMVRRIDPLTFGKAIAEASFFLCTSVMEGYGHYINQARASGGVIITTDIAPMNEIIASTSAGVFVETEKYQNPRQFLSGANKGVHALRDVEGVSAHFSGEEVCRAVEFMLRTTDEDNREAMAMHARALYHADTKFFAHKMRMLRRFAKKQLAQPSAWTGVFRRRSD